MEPRYTSVNNIGLTISTRDINSPPAYEEICSVYTVSGEHKPADPPPSYDEACFHNYTVSPNPAAVHPNNGYVDGAGVDYTRSVVTSDTAFGRELGTSSTQVYGNATVPRSSHSIANPTRANRRMVIVVVISVVSTLTVAGILLAILFSRFHGSDVEDGIPEWSSQVQRCLNSTDCWVKYAFDYDQNWTACHGAQYVRQTEYHTGRYIGVVLCSSQRYKLFMADSLSDVFLNIGDGNGHGQDHCEFIGTSNDATSIDRDFWDSPGTTGYIRSIRGHTPRKGRIGGGTGSTWTGKYYGKWIECGVSIPGNSRVVFWAKKTESISSTTSATPTTVTHPIDWDQVEYKVTRILTDTTLTIPHGVTKVDVICIGGGGGGKDGHSKYTKSNAFGGDGGSSLFGIYLRAEGGKGANADNTGGEGGNGNVADGGQGGIGGGCSAGAGAAGQTSGGGGGLVPGSSTYPYCGAGGSSGGSSCGTEFASIPPGKSGPGGVDPSGRAGGLYGGGGGSRAGGRAGGGGGYSRKVVHVSPGQKIDITVGKAGSPSYAKSGQGIVIVSWGGHIDLFEKTSTTTTKKTISTIPTEVTNCLNSKYCWVNFNFRYEDNWNDCHGKQYIRKTTYNVGKYVGVVLCSSNRYKLFMADSLSDVFLNIADGSGHGQDHCEFIGTTNDATSIDRDFWDSPGTTGYIRSIRGHTPRKGRIGGGTGSTWTGKYYGKWIKCGVSIPGNSRVVFWAGKTGSSPVPEVEPTADASQGTSPVPEVEPTPDVSQATRCFGGRYCPGSYTTGARCVNGYCVCSSPFYNYQTCLPDFDGCSIETNKVGRGIPSFGGRNSSNIYSCVNKSSLSLSPEVHVLGCYENINRRPPQAGVTIVNIEGATTRPVVLVLSTYEPVAWQITVPTGVTIQKILMYAYYADESSVTVSDGSNPPVDKSRDIACAYGSDNGGCTTVKLMKKIQSLFGHVTSFSGTYKVDHWSLKVGN